MCLQEVQGDHYESMLKPALEQMGYEAIFKTKTREAMGMAGKVDGCALIWRRSKFRLSESKGVEFNEIAKQAASELAEGNIEQTRDIMNRLTKDNIAQVVVLELLHTGRERHRISDVPQYLCVANTHLYSNTLFPDVKLWQCYQLLLHLEQITMPRDIPLLLCGDFNSVPNSAVYELLSQARVNPRHPDLAEDPAKILPPSNEITHSLELASTFAVVGDGAEPTFTNYTAEFKGVLDYIWYTRNVMSPTAIRPLPTPQQIRTEGLPNTQFPSDHLMLCAELQLTAM